jgi:hypothetical protein
MNSLSAGLAAASPSEVRFAATVSSKPHFFFGNTTRAWHEAFQVCGDDGSSVEVVDNVALAPPVPVAPGDRVLVQGELIPHAARGPLVHWTHHDPSHRHQDGFIELHGRRYA